MKGISALDLKLNYNRIIHLHVSVEISQFFIIDSPSGFNKTGLPEAEVFTSLIYTLAAFLSIVALANRLSDPVRGFP